MHLVFMGDSRVRQVYYEFVSFLRKDTVPRESVHHSMQYQYDNATLLVVRIEYYITIILSYNR